MDKKIINKYTIGTFIGVLVIIGMVVVFSENKIEVSLPSDVCSSSILRVTKDDFTLKCGNRIAFQADTVIDYYKTYGTDEWVRNQRFVGRNKKDITLDLVEYADSFDIIRTTKYRKGRQSVADGTLTETYTFTKDKVKINYDYLVNNNAEHKISMRIKKQYNSYLNPFDPLGHTAFVSDNLVSYKGTGDLHIDPEVTLSPYSVTPTNGDIRYNESDTIAFTCAHNMTPHNISLVNVSLYWDAIDGSTMTLAETTAVTANGTATFSNAIPHMTSNKTGNFTWTCLVCNSSGWTHEGCAYPSANYTLNATYKPHNLTQGLFQPDDPNLNILDIAGFNMSKFYVNYTNTTANSEHAARYLVFNWSWPGSPDDGEDAYGITWNVSYFGTNDATRTYLREGDGGALNYSTDNLSVYGTLNLTHLVADDYYITVQACAGHAASHSPNNCVNRTNINPIEIFNFDVNTTTGGMIRFSPQPTTNFAQPYGQTDSKGIIQIDWEGYGAPDGDINFTMNFTDETTSCLKLYGARNSSVSNTNFTHVDYLSNSTYNQIWKTVSTTPTYVWLWANKTDCSSTTTNWRLDFEVLGEWD